MNRSVDLTCTKLNLCPYHDLIVISGTGASCIYPLLGCRLHENWSFYCTELDEQSSSVARLNITQNGLEERIKLFNVKSTNDELFMVVGAESFHFCMCNPPFYSSIADIQRRKELKQAVASTQLEYTPSESIYPGGEVAFVGQIISESLRLGKQITWYTSLLGLKESINVLERRLKDHQVPQVKILPSQVGTTKRWVLAWSFHKRQEFKKRKSDRVELIFPTKIIQPLEWLKRTFERMAIQSQADNHFQTTRLIWTRKGQRAILHGKSVPELLMDFNIEFHGSICEFSVTDKDHWNDLIALVNHLKHQLSIE